MLTGLVAAGGAATALLAMAALIKLLGLPKLLRQFKHFLADWLGEEARPGRDAVPSIPSRIANLEDSHVALMERMVTSDHKLRGDLTGQLGGIQATLRERAGQNADILAKIDQVDTRITDHRRRNDDQIGLLQRAVDALLVRADRGDERLSRIEAHAADRRASDTSPDTTSTEEPEPPVSPGYDQ